MSYYPSQAYGAYSPAQQPYSAYPSSTQYNAQYQSPTQAFSSTAMKSATSEQPSAPVVSEVTPTVASQALQKVVSSELRLAGFSSVQPLALQRLELEFVAFIEQVFKLAHDYSNHANRGRPIATDVMRACTEFGMEIKDLHRVELLSKKRKRDGLEAEMPVLLPPASRTPSPELLESDDENTTPIIPTTLRTHPHYLPPLPPKHTYLRTPASPPKKAALPSLEKKLKNASLVQESLRHLLQETEEVNEKDALSFVPIVNYESGVYPRKRWKLSS